MCSSCCFLCLIFSVSVILDSRAGLHDNVPDRPSLRQGCTCWVSNSRGPRHLQLKLSGLRQHKFATQSVTSVSASGLSSREPGGFLPPWQSIGWDVVVQPGPAVHRDGQSIHKSTQHVGLLVRELQFQLHRQ